MGKNNEPPKDSARADAPPEADNAANAAASGGADSALDNSEQAGAPPEADNPDNAPSPPDKAKEKRVEVTARHKTKHQFYRCAGLALKQTAESHQVTKAQLERLRRDPWVEVAEPKDSKE